MPPIASTGLRMVGRPLDIEVSCEISEFTRRISSRGQKATAFRGGIGLSLGKVGHINDTETCEDAVTWRWDAANNYAPYHPGERAAALLHMSEGGDHIGRYSDTHFTTGVVIFTLTAVVLRCGRQGETTTLLSRGVAATPLFYLNT